MSCQVYLIRHGRTAWNVEERLQGHTDIPLNEEGESQAYLLKEKLKNIQFSAVFSSDLSRANRTASIVLNSQKVEIIKTPALRERYMGVWEGRLASELTSWFKEQALSTDNFSQDAYLSYKWQNDIESYAEVYQRLRDLLVRESISHQGSTILVSSHGGVLRALLYQLDFHSGLRWEVSNCAYLKLHVTAEGNISIVGHEGAKLIAEAAIP